MCQHWSVVHSVHEAKMSETVFSQDVFSRGEISPLLYSRVTLEAYYKGLKTATNVLTFPTGAAGKRFGTIYLNEVTGVDNYKQISFDSFTYLNECVYLIVIVPGFIKIYLEGILIATVDAPTLTAAVIPLIDTTTLENQFRVCTGLDQPRDLARSAGVMTAQTISGISSNRFIVAPGGTAGFILPIRFTTTGDLPSTTPAIRTDITYFAYYVSSTTIELYANPGDASARVNAFVLNNAGTGTNNIQPFNTWNFDVVVFQNLPTFDFTENYDSINFTPSAVTGNNITITASDPIFTLAYVGGVFSGNSGIGRIIAYTSSTVIHLYVVQDFKNLNPIIGTVAFLGEPAWSDPIPSIGFSGRGWPAKCSSFQNRAAFANTPSIPNGLWLSVTNDFNNFYDLETDDDFAISWLPSSDNINYIRFIVPYRSLTIHSNSGIYSTPLSFETAITPKTFSMTLQDSTPATAIQPRGIDNQIIIVSGNDVHSMLWDGFNNSYNSAIASVMNEHLIRSPHDECAYVDLTRAGSKYMFIINDDGSMPIFQTLISEGVQGFTPARLEQTYGNAYFRWAASSTEGRAWFLTEREIAINGASSPIDEFTETTLGLGVTFNLLSGTNFTLLSGSMFDTLAFSAIFPIGIPTPFEFITTGSLPTSSPQIEEGRYYWALGLPDNEFQVYLSKEDAELAVNPITFSALGSNTIVRLLALTTKFFIEELSFDSKVDCATFFNGAPRDSFSGESRFTGQNVSILGDGYAFTDQVYNGVVEVQAHGQDVNVSVGQFGFPIHMVIEPLQVATPGATGAKSSTLVFPQHIRVASYVFVDTVGGFINGQPITLNNISQIAPNTPPVPRTGVMQTTLMKGWNEPLDSGITIEHSDPYDIKLTGIFYKIES